MKYLGATALIPTALILMACHANAACSINNSMPDDVKTVIADHGGIPISDADCQLVNTNHLYLDVHGDFFAGSKAAVGWALVELEDVNNIRSDTSAQSTHFSDRLGDGAARDAEFAAISNSIKTLDFTKAIKQIRSYESR